MAVGLLGIASGAAKIGQKIFQGVKNRKEKKIEKRAAALVEAQEKKAIVENKYGAIFSSMGGEGTQAISGSGNFLAGIKGAFSPNPNIAAFTPISGAMAVQKQNEDLAQSQGSPKMNPLILIGAGLVLVLLFFKKR